MQDQLLFIKGFQRRGSFAPEMQITVNLILNNGDTFVIQQRYQFLLSLIWHDKSERILEIGNEQAGFHPIAIQPARRSDLRSDICFPGHRPMIPLLKDIREKAIPKACSETGSGYPFLTQTNTWSLEIPRLKNKC